ncbi:MAG TPA: hypothetical protein ENL20_00060 [Candidatus Cloacimonetes bacterium]|nr:hypothetical protein [Candidatus Cloacimonadota bacterium]
MKKSKVIILFLFLCFHLFSQEMTLDYLYRYNCQEDGIDHLVTAAMIKEDSVIVGGYPAMALLDINDLTVNGTSDYIFRSENMNSRNFYQKDNYIFVNRHANAAEGSFDFAVVRFDGDVPTVVYESDEPDVFFEKMCIEGDYLYVAAHNQGIWIYDISDPELPLFEGNLTTGFTDAFAVAVEGDSVYVADGGAGLKIVNIENKEFPFIVAEETLETALGTAEAITVRDGKVYMTLGGEGLAVYDSDDISSQEVISTYGFSEDLCWIGDYLAVSTYPGVVIYDVSGNRTPTVAARENWSRRGFDAELRIGCGIAASGDSLLISANWNYLDFYEFKPVGESTQPDINSDTHRVRFSPSGGTKEVTITNNGEFNLQIYGISSTSPQFSVPSPSGILQPGESNSFDIDYTPSTPPGQDMGRILIDCNDPDESPYPIQVFGRTDYLDPEESADDFTLPLISKDILGNYTQDSFTLSDQEGKIVWIGIYASW